MDKIIELDTQNEKGVFLYTIAEGRDHGFLKTASAEFHPEIKKYIDNAKPIPGIVQILLTALGAGEYFGENRNGDYFPESELKYEGYDYGHKTFETMANIFKHHVNKDPSKGYGKVKLSIWNDRMKRVELVVHLETAKAPDIAEKINNGEYLPVSMGCLKEDSLVLCSDFKKKKISEFEPGDKVLNAFGGISVVDYKHSHHHVGEWFKVKVLGIRELEPTTEEHPWLVVPKEQLKCLNSKNNRTKCFFSESDRKKCEKCVKKEDKQIQPQWKKASDLEIDDYVGQPIYSIQNECTESESFVSLLGLYLAEGIITSDGYVSFTVNNKEVEPLKEEFKDTYLFSVRPHHDSKEASILSIYDKDLATKLNNYAGRRSGEKLLSSEVMGWPESFQKVLLGSYLNGDGGVYKGSIYYSTCNSYLADQIWHLLARCGMVASININRHKPSTIVKKDTVEFQVWVGVNYAYKMMGYTRKTGLRKSIRNTEKRFIYKGAVWSPIKKIDKTICNEVVYNIAIKSEKYDTDSYIVNSVGLHNCRVIYDVCSICGNKAPQVKDYCDHLRYHMKKIPPGHNKKAYAINIRPKFFDISFVLIGADETASTLMKVASLKSNDMTKLAFGLDKQKIASRKTATIEKEIPSNLEGNVVQEIADLGSQGAEALTPLEPEIDRHIIVRVSRENPGIDGLSRLLTTLISMGIIPKPREFQTMTLNCLGHSNLADQYDFAGHTFDPYQKLEEDQQRACDHFLDLSPENYSPSVFENFRPFIADRSYARPILAKRVLKLVKLAEQGKLHYPRYELIKKAEDKKPIGILPMMLTLTGLYMALKDKLPAATSGIDKILTKNPAMAAALGIGSVMGLNALMQHKVKGHFDYNLSKGPLPINQTWQEEINNKNNNPTIKTSSVAKRLFFGVPLLYAGSGALEVKKARNPEDNEGFVSSFFRKNPDLASAALVGEGLAGFPITQRIGGVLKKLPSLIKKAGDEGALYLEKISKDNSNLGQLRKTADLKDDAITTAVYSLAFPGTSLATRAAASVVDSGIMTGISKLLNYKNKTGVKNGNNQ